jgi:hypothetical protein
MARVTPEAPVAMTEQAAMTGPPEEKRGTATDPRVMALEARVRRLEDAVASLQDTRQLEERVVESVTAKVGRGRSNGLRESAGLILEAGRHLLPAAVDAVRDGDPPPDPSPAATAKREPSRTSWLLWDLYADARAMLRMYVDPRYRLGWQGRLLPLALVAAIVTSWIWIPGTSILPNVLSSLLVKAVDLVLAYVLFKIVLREVRRYRETSPDLPPSLRL